MALIVDPGTPCSDTAIQQIHLTKGFVEAGLDLAYPDCTATSCTSRDSIKVPIPAFGIMSWFWQLTLPSGNQLSSTQQNPIFKVSQTGNYSLWLIAKSFNGCRDSVLLSFMAPIPPVNLLEEELAICIGDTIPLFPQADPLYSYAWSPAASLSDSTAANPLAFPLETTTYSVTASGNGPCVRTGDITVTVVQPGALSATATPDTIIQGQSSQLYADLPLAESLVWGPDYALSDPNIANPVASPFQTTDYVVTAIIRRLCATGLRFAWSC